MNGNSKREKHMLGAWAEGDWTPGRGLGAPAGSQRQTGRMRLQAREMQRTGIKPANQRPPAAVLSAKEGKFHPPAHGQAEEAWLPHGIWEAESPQ